MAAHVPPSRVPGECSEAERGTRAPVQRLSRPHAGEPQRRQVYAACAGLAAMGVSKHEGHGPGRPSFETRARQRVRAPQDEADHRMCRAASRASQRRTTQPPSLPQRVCAPGFWLPLFHPPHEGRAERRKAQYVCCRARDARPSTPGEARRASSGTRSPLGAPPWRFSVGGRASISGISSGSVQRAPRAAAAGRHSPLRLRRVSGDGPSDERG
jgi:hypothetical protein